MQLIMLETLLASVRAADEVAGGTIGNNRRCAGRVVPGAATFHGSNNVNDDDSTEVQRVKYPKTKYPTADLAGVTGWFDADERYRRPCGRLWRGLQHWNYVREVGQPPRAASGRPFHFPHL